MSQLGSPVGRSFHLDFSEYLLPNGGLDREVEEPRPDNLDSVEELLTLSKIVDDNLGNVVGRSLLRHREGHGDRRS
jgi:hypothetical protein